MTIAHPRPWRRDSVFSAGPCRPLTIGEQAVFRARLHAAFGRRLLTRAWRDVGFTLLRLLGTDGRLDPSYATLARETGCDAKTVGAALRGLEALGMLRRQRRMVREATRSRQITNAYELIPDGQPLPPAKPRRDGNFSREGQKIFVNKLPQPVSWEEQAAARRLLACVADEARVRLAAAWSARRGQGAAPPVRPPAAPPPSR